jgi:hypothetical protein
MVVFILKRAFNSSPAHRRFYLAFAERRKTLWLLFLGRALRGRNARWGGLWKTAEQAEAREGAPSLQDKSGLKVVL